MLPSICSPPARSLPSLLRLLHTCPRASVALRALSPTRLPFYHLHARPHGYTCHSQLLHRLSLSSVSSVATSSPLTEASSSSSSSSSSKLPPAETFFADDGVTWKSLGLSQEVVEALERAQLHRPSIVQGVAIPSILTESDVVMAAETGSGKTQAYLAPLFHKLLKRRQINRKTEEDPSVQVLQHFALVLCPNGMLCEQVAEMANALCDGTGAPLLKASVISGGQGWPITPPDLVIATPAALMNHLFAFDPRRRRRNAFIRDVKYVVFDEADMLLSGGFENQVIRLLNLLRFEEKQLSKLKSQEAMLATVESKPLDARPWTDFEPVEVTSEDGVATEDLEGSLESDEDQKADSSDCAEDEAPRPEHKQKRDWFRIRKLYTRSKQYIFAAATLPENGKKTPGAVLRRLFPEAKWVNGLFLHRHNPRLQERWLEVDESTQVKALLDAVAEDPSSFSDSFPKKTLVFANSVEAVDAIFKILQRSKIDCLCYHRDVPAEERTRSLKVFQEKGGVLVCTDAAARGLDIPNISHVIQAEFAKSAVEFLHRVGRTARAGQSGMVTSLYTKINKPLVEAVKQAKAVGLPVEGAFSRKRSFRNKLKRSELASR